MPHCRPSDINTELDSPCGTDSEFDELSDLNATLIGQLMDILTHHHEGLKVVRNKIKKSRPITFIQVELKETKRFIMRVTRLLNSDRIREKLDLARRFEDQVKSQSRKLSEIRREISVLKLEFDNCCSSDKSLADQDAYKTLNESLMLEKQSKIQLLHKIREIEKVSRGKHNICISLDHKLNKLR